MTGVQSGHASIEISEDGNKSNYLVKLQNKKIQGDKKPMTNTCLKDIAQKSKLKYFSP